MINVGMTIREMVSIAAKTDSNDLYERIIKALEVATGNVKLLIGCNGVNCVYEEGRYWKHKIPAIKAVRLATNWGLKETKEWIESCQYDSKTNFTPPLDRTVANQLCDELRSYGMDCYTINS